MCAASDPGCVNPRRVSRTAPGRAESITFCIKDLRRHLQSRVLMSAKGQKRTLQCILVMSALPPKADIGTQSRNVRFVPGADILRCGRDRPHSITSSARARTDGGTARPSALAVLRLITSSYLVGA